MIGDGFDWGRVMGELYISYTIQNKGSFGGRNIYPLYLSLSLSLSLLSLQSPLNIPAGICHVA